MKSRRLVKTTKKEVTTRSCSNDKLRKSKQLRSPRIAKRRSRNSRSQYNREHSHTQFDRSLVTPPPYNKMHGSQ